LPRFSDWLEVIVLNKDFDFIFVEAKNLPRLNVIDSGRILVGEF
jgi:hypothetical protein